MEAVHAERDQCPVEVLIWLPERPGRDREAQTDRKEERGIERHIERGTEREERQAGRQL